MGDLKGKRVIDYGCGAGFFSVYAAQSGAAKVVGVDAEESALATARHFARDARRGTSVHVCAKRPISLHASAATSSM